VRFAVARDAENIRSSFLNGETAPFWSARTCPRFEKRSRSRGIAALPKDTKALKRARFVHLASQGFSDLAIALGRGQRCGKNLQQFLTFVH
jgi:hypothetical protein